MSQRKSTRTSSAAGDDGKRGHTDRERARYLFKQILQHLRNPVFIRNVHDFIQIVASNQNTPPGDGSFDEESWRSAFKYADNLNRLITVLLETKKETKTEDEK